METALTHRFRTGHEYNGIQIHAAPGVHEFCLQLLDLPKGSKVLDVGSGSGALAARLGDTGFDVLATDITDEDFRASCRHMIWDANDSVLPAPEGSVDAVCAVEILEHVENPIAALRNFKCLLKPGGVLIASTPNISHPKARLKYLMHGWPSYFGPREYRGSGHRTLLPDWLLRLHVVSAGFSIERIAYAGRIETRYPNVLRVVNWLGQRLLRIPPFDDGDGACTFVVARKQHI